MNGWIGEEKNGMKMPNEWIQKDAKISRDVETDLVNAQKQDGAT